MNKEKLTVETDEDDTVTYLNDSDKLYNPDGPAVIWDGDKYYWTNGELHNERASGY